MTRVYARMKHTLLILVATTIVGTSAFADYLERGVIVSKNGTKVMCVYLFREKGQNNTVYLVFPEGSDAQVDIEAGASRATMQRALAKIVEDRLR